MANRWDRPSITPDERERCKQGHKDGKPYVQIARELDRPLGTVKFILHGLIRSEDVTRRNQKGPVRWNWRSGS